MHSRQLGVHRNFDVSATLNYTDNTTDGVSSKSDITTLDLHYRDGRFFGLRSLVFDTRLRGSIDSLFSNSTIEQPEELLWESELTYEIGLLLLRARATFSKADDGNNAIYLLSAERRF